MLSSGDLDGDIFCVIWDRRIVDQCWNVPAMNYQGKKEQPLTRPVNIDDVKDFFVRYMKNDNLGQIANAHLIHSDRESRGIFSDNTIELAELHSTAVDFAKTGVAAKMPRRLIIRNRENEYPDYMMRHRSVSYKSPNALGLMYRNCSDKIANEGLRPFSTIDESHLMGAVLERFCSSDVRACRRAK